MWLQKDFNLIILIVIKNIVNDLLENSTMKRMFMTIFALMTIVSGTQMHGMMSPAIVLHNEPVSVVSVKKKALAMVSMSTAAMAVGILAHKPNLCVQAAKTAVQAVKSVSNETVAHNYNTYKNNVAYYAMLKKAVKTAEKGTQSIKAVSVSAIPLLSAGPSVTLASVITKSPASPVNKYVCDHFGCDKGYSILDSLARHKTRAHGPKTFICKPCNKSFAQSWNMQRHEQSAKHIENARQFIK